MNGVRTLHLVFELSGRQSLNIKTVQVRDPRLLEYLKTQSTLKIQLIRDNLQPIVEVAVPWTEEHRKAIKAVRP